MESSQNRFAGELIGKMITVEKATNHSLVGLIGKIINETKSTLTISTAKKEVMLLKKGLTLRLAGRSELIKGIDLLKKPEERLKGK